jgi:hypothetical protein
MPTSHLRDKDGIESIAISHFSFAGDLGTKPSNTSGVRLANLED